MQSDGVMKPRLRPVEAFAIRDGEARAIGVRDRSGLSDVVLSLSAPALHVLSLMDGEHTCEEIRRAFFERFGQVLSASTLTTMIEHLQSAYLLEGPTFERHYQERLAAYRTKAVREMPHAAGLGVEPSGAVFAAMLAEAKTATTTAVKGVIAPHLDYPRGRPCYAAAYAALRNRPAPQRVVVLGTNHFGRSTAAVATGNDFVTPLGTTRVDRDFLDKLEVRCGDLRVHELDHAREHSIELQVAWLQFLFGAEEFSIVPILCPDPCGPTGTAPRDGNGVDLRKLAESIGELTRDDPADTLLVAGADLSHVGAAFGDDEALDEARLDAVRRRDRTALSALVEDGADAFVQRVAHEDNPTRVCSAGCIFTLSHALAGGCANLAEYHQAVDLPSQTCVTCAAVLYT